MGILTAYAVKFIRVKADEISINKDYKKTIKEYKDVQKFYASLARKGFDFNTIKKAVKTVINKDFEEENNFD